MQGTECWSVMTKQAAKQSERLIDGGPTRADSQHITAIKYILQRQRALMAAAGFIYLFLVGSALHK